MKILILILSISLSFESFAGLPVFETPSLPAILNPFEWNKNTELRRGRSFGGSRRSYSRGSSRRRSSSSNRSRRSKSSRNRSSSSGLAASPKRPSFGGKRISASQARKKYSTPRKKETVTRKSANGTNQTYVMNSYGGYGSGLMTGYMMGSSMWYWSMPFHPAFYYGRPAYVTNPDGTVGVYPPTFSWSRLFFTLMIVGLIGYLIYRAISQKRKYANASHSGGSFG